MSFRPTISGSQRTNSMWPTAHFRTANIFTDSDAAFVPLSCLCFVKNKTPCFQIICSTERDRQTEAETETDTQTDGERERERERERRQWKGKGGRKVKESEKGSGKEHRQSRYIYIGASVSFLKGQHRRCHLPMVAVHLSAR